MDVLDHFGGVLVYFEGLQLTLLFEGQEVQEGLRDDLRELFVLFYQLSNQFGNTLVPQEGLFALILFTHDDHQFYEQHLALALLHLVQQRE